MSENMAKAWPDHAGHRITYTETRQTAYLVTDVDIETWEGIDDLMPIAVTEHLKEQDAEVTHCEFHCDTCNQYLPS